MFCGSCGAGVPDGAIACPNCGRMQNSNQGNINNGYGNNKNFPKPIKTGGLLAWSIIELLCVSPVAGLIAIILYCIQLKPAVNSGDIVLVDKAKQALKVVLWVGLITYIIAFIISFIVIFPIVTAVTGAVNATNVSNYEDLDRITNYFDKITNDTGIYEEFNYSYEYDI